MSFIYIRRKKLFIPVVSHLVETWENLTCDKTFFFFFLSKSAQGVSDIYRDNRETAWSQAWGNSEMASKMRTKKQQQTSKELNDASLSLFICCWAVTNLKIEEINQIIPIIQSKYFSVSAWLNPGLIPFCV